jgi:signal transduction histidine kinase
MLKISSIVTSGEKEVFACLDITMKILIAEDSLTWRLLLSETLQNLGHEVVAAKDGKEAWNAFQEQEFTVLISDWIMPDVDGLELCRRIRAEKRSGYTYFLLLTSLGGRENYLEAMNAGVDDFITKPFEQDHLAARLRVAQRILTEMRERQQAEAASRAKDEFLSILSHELRTPLTSIMGWASLLQSGNLDPASVTEGISIIVRQAQAQTKLVDDLLDASRIITGKMVTDVSLLELAPIIQAEVESARSTAESQGIQLQMRVDAEVGLVSGDATRLKQVMCHLLSNAIKFTPRGGQVEVRLERVGSCAQITVSDTGQGIKRETLPTIFEGFRQADSSATRQHGGLGLGLTIVRHLVEAHGGTVSAHSPGEGQGTIVTVKLPVLSDEATAPTIEELTGGFEPDRSDNGIRESARDMSL